MNAFAESSTGTTPTRQISLRWTIFGAPLLILFSAYLLTSNHLVATPPAASANKTLPSDDDWRRTAAGWERAHSWPTAISSSWRSFRTRNLSSTNSSAARSVTTRPPRLDTHPAALALAQLLACLLALTLFRSPRRPSLYLSSILSAISRSFRASAFGS